MLDQKHCVPCEGGTPPLSHQEIEVLKIETPKWSVIHDQSIERQFLFKNFKEALAFVNTVGKIAESEGHHPDIHLENWNTVTLSLMTHAIGGLSENDFILARKVDLL